MIDWHRDRARQERDMMNKATCVEARAAHAGMLDLLLRDCPWRCMAQQGAECSACDLLSECVSLSPADPHVIHRPHVGLWSGRDRSNRFQTAS